MRVTLTNVSWDVPLEESLFALEAPSGYRVETVETAPSERGLVRMLRICAELNGGVFPDRLDDGTVHGLIAEATGGAEAPLAPDGTLGLSDTTERGRSLLSECVSGLAFMREARERDAWRYSGRHVRLGDEDQVVCFWVVPGSDERRAVYGDLEVRPAPPAQP
jgi:hypothetical protein